MFRRIFWALVAITLIAGLVALRRSYLAAAETEAAEFEASVQLGAPYASVAERCRSVSFRLECKEDIEQLTVDAPFELDTTGWIVIVDFAEERVSRVYVRTMEGLEAKPSNAPRDRYIEAAGPPPHGPL